MGRIESNQACWLILFPPNNTRKTFILAIVAEIKCKKEKKNNKVCHLNVNWKWHLLSETKFFCLYDDIECLKTIKGIIHKIFWNSSNCIFFIIIFFWVNRICLHSNSCCFSCRLMFVVTDHTNENMSYQFQISSEQHTIKPFSGKYY